MNLRAGSVFALAVLSQGCGDDPLPPPGGPISGGTLGEELVLELDCPELPPSSERTRVLVVDQGFDPRHPVFEGKLAGCYRLKCPAAPPAEPRPTGDDDTEAARYMESLSASAAECEIEKGVTLRIDAFLERFAEGHRSEWNAAMFEKRSLSAESKLDASRMQDLLQGETTGEDARFDYHATATAGALAYENDVEIVFVEKELYSSAEAEALARQGECTQPDEFAQLIRLLQRDDVRRAFVQSPLSGEDAALRDLRRQHGIRVENRSFGRASIPSLRSRLQVSPCPELPLEEYAELLAGLESEREAFWRASGELDGADPLVLQGAGNDGFAIDTGADAIDCAPDRASRLLVGAYGMYRGQPARAAFTNYGDCVDLYGLGDSVVVPAPNGFYVPASGTSIAAPLVARHAAALARDGLDTAELRERLIGLRDEFRFLPLPTMPIELALYSYDRIEPQAASHGGGRLVSFRTSGTR